MRIDLKEKLILYSFGGFNLDETIHRIRMIAAIPHDPTVKNSFRPLASSSERTEVTVGILASTTTSVWKSESI